MWGLLSVIKELAFSDPNKADKPYKPGPTPPPDEQRVDGHRGGMTQDQFFTELEKLTETE